MIRFVVLCLLLLEAATVSGKYRFSDTSNLWHGMLSTYGPEEREMAVGASYHGDTVIHDTLYRILRGEQPIGIREDTVAGRIFCRFLTPKFRFNQTDSFEHVLFDYTLQVGDTFRMSYGSFRTAHRVQTITNVQFNGVTHRVWYMQSFRAPGTSPLARAYYFTEGIGPTAMPHFSVCAAGFEDWYQLLCYRTQRTRAHCTPAIGMFDNDKSCSYPVGVTDVKLANVVVVKPNPGNREMQIHLGGALSGTLFVCDAAGRDVISDHPISSQEPVPLGQLLNGHGMYFYRIIVPESGQRLTGTFVYR